MFRPLEAVIFDWAGTMVDFGSFAPTRIFVDAFRQAFDFEISLDEARGPMGLGKWQHIEALGREPAIAARWQARFGEPMATAQVRHIYDTFLPMQIEAVARYSDLIPGAADLAGRLRAAGLKIGSTTGYPRAVIERLVPLADAAGYAPDCVVASDDLAAGARPGPWMALECVNRLAVGAVAHCVKVDDTAPGIAEGVNAGMWPVGLALSGSPAGLTRAQYEAASALELSSIRARVGVELRAAGAHRVVDSVADLDAVLLEFAARLARGERP